MHQVGCRVRLEEQARELADLERDLEARAVVDPARDDRSAFEPAERVDGASATARSARRAARARARARARPRAGRRREQQRDRAERVDVGLRRRDGALARPPRAAAPPQLAAAIGDSRSFVIAIGRPALAPRLGDHRVDVRGLARSARCRPRARRRGAAAARTACRATESRTRPARGWLGRAGTARSGPRSTSCRARRSGRSGRRRGGRAREPLRVLRLPLEQARERLGLLRSSSSSRVRHAAAPAEQRGVVGRRGCRRRWRRSRAPPTGRQTGSPVSTTTAPGHVGGRLHPVMPVRVADDEHVRLRDRTSPSRTITACRSECSASPAAMFAAGRSSTTRGARSNEMSPPLSARAAPRPLPTERSTARRGPGRPSAASSRMRPAASSQAILGHARGRARRRPRRRRLVERRPHHQPVAARDQRLDREVADAGARAARHACRARRATSAREAELVAQQVRAARAGSASRARRRAPERERAPS